MTEGSAVSAFDLTSARPDTAHQQVGGSPGLPGTRNGCMLGLNRRPIWWMSVKGYCKHRITRSAVVSVQSQPIRSNSWG